MYKETGYVQYRKKRVPAWWMDYLPEEKNPYKENDTLTLQMGCLADYWHIHSSNKHPNFRGVQASNMVHEMVRERFGGAFLTAQYFHIGGRQGEKTYHEPEHLVYENAYLGEAEKIHIKNARQYYEDVVAFVLRVLQEISRNHMQSAGGYGDALMFFPNQTDGEMEESRRQQEERKKNTELLREKLQEEIQKEDFLIREFGYESVEFEASHDFEDGWFNEEFKFRNIVTNLDMENTGIKVIINLPRLFHASTEKKDLQKVNKKVKMDYCLYLERKGSADCSNITLPIPEDKVTDEVKAKINAACNQAMEEYNAGHMEVVEGMSSRLGYKYYPKNYFLDNLIGKLELVYRENAGAGTWRMRWM